MNGKKGEIIVIATEESRIDATGKIEVLLHEYDTLRSEMLERHMMLVQSQGFALAVAGAIATIALAHPWLAGLFALPAALAFLFTWRRFDLDTKANALGICALERRINFLAGEGLLQWESEWGVLSDGFPMRDKRVKTEFERIAAARRKNRSIGT